MYHREQASATRRFGGDGRPCGTAAKPEASAPSPVQRSLDRLEELGHVNGFHEVLAEAGLLALSAFLRRVGAAEGDALDRVMLPCLPHEVDAVAVGEAEVANDDVERPGVKVRFGVAEPAGGRDGTAGL